MRLAPKAVKRSAPQTMSVGVRHRGDWSVSKARLASSSKGAAIDRGPGLELEHADAREAAHEDRGDRRPTARRRPRTRTPVIESKTCGSKPITITPENVHCDAEPAAPSDDFAQEDDRKDGRERHVELNHDGDDRGRGQGHADEHQAEMDGAVEHRDQHHIAHAAGRELQDTGSERPRGPESASPRTAAAAFAPRRLSRRRS